MVTLKQYSFIQIKLIEGQTYPHFKYIHVGLLDFVKKKKRKIIHHLRLFHTSFYSRSGSRNTNFVSSKIKWGGNWSSGDCSITLFHVGRAYLSGRILYSKPWHFVEVERRWETPIRLDTLCSFRLTLISLFYNFMSRFFFCSLLSQQITNSTFSSLLPFFFLFS